MEARVLIIDSDTGAAQKVGLALDGAKLPVTWCSFAPSEVAENLRDFKPTLLLVHAEPSSPQLMTLLARLESTPLPVALLCKDVADERFVRQMRLGVVELIPEPFGRAHVGRLRDLLESLPLRSGELRGRGGGREVTELVQHVMRVRRTGGLTVGDNGRAFFVRGVLKAARVRDLTMQAALAQMTRESGAWSFVEGVEGTSSLVDFMGDDEPPFVVAGNEGGEPRSLGQASGGSSSVPALEDASPFGMLQGGGGWGGAGGSLQPATPSTPLDPDAGRTPMLFVDDDQAVVSMMAGYFGKRGYPVSTAADGLEAMTLLVTRSFEVVIADLNMPRLDGWGLLRLVREDLRTHETPVALFSAHDNYRDSLRLLHAGAQAYFPKSLRLTALELQVRELCEPRRRFTRLISSDGGIEFNFGALGPQWVLKALTLAGYSGQVDARDGWATWRLWFDAGRLVQVSAKMGATVVSGDRALASFVTAKAEGSLSRASTVPDEGFTGQSTAAILGRLVPWLNDEQRRAQEGQLAKARALQINDELYRLFLSVGPPAWQPVVRMLCEEKLTPAEVMQRTSIPPQDLAVIVKELLRRGVATLQ